ncbi:MAG: hypothetical protein ACI4WM_08900 [Erysipelotrichaceae bacterium]
MEINEFLREIEKSGFIYESDYITGKTKYFKGDNELEFLTTLSRDGGQIQKFGYIAAESLPKLDILVNNTVEVSWMTVKSLFHPLKLMFFTKYS